MTIEKFDVRNRWTNRVQFTAEIEVTPDMTTRVKLGLAVRWARKSGAVLSGAVLRDADLSGADLSGAVLRDADLSGADLSGAVLRDADLSGADLSGAVLRDAVLRDADLSGADLSGAVLRDAVLRDAVLRDADLSGAVLRDAVLRDAVLRDAVLSGADLSGAVLRDAVLRGADLSDTNLRSFKADFWMILLGAQKEVPGLIKALKAGRVNGSTYSGECACLVGTIANIRGVNVDTLEQDSRRPAEQWFLMIREGDKPGDDTGGGFAAGKALEWAEEFLALTTPPKKVRKAS